jgi:hypothetical protein
MKKIRNFLSALCGIALFNMPAFICIYSTYHWAITYMLIVSAWYAIKKMVDNLPMPEEHNATT